MREPKRDPGRLSDILEAETAKNDMPILRNQVQQLYNIVLAKPPGR